HQEQEKMRHTKHLWGRRDSSLRSYLKRLGSHATTATSPTSPSADPQTTANPNPPKSSSASASISRRSSRKLTLGGCSYLAIRHCEEWWVEVVLRNTAELSFSLVRQSPLRRTTPHTLSGTLDILNRSG